MTQKKQFTAFFTHKANQCGVTTTFETFPVAQDKANKLCQQAIQRLKSSLSEVPERLLSHAVFQALQVFCSIDLSKQEAQAQSISSSVSENASTTFYRFNLFR